MKGLHILFFLTSFCTLIFTAFLFYSESNPEWKTYQLAYQQVLNLQETDASVSIVETAIGIRQDWNPDLQIVDRCRTCHLGVNNSDAPQKQPFSVHPDIYPHKFSQLGCTTCHQGDGFATRLPDAHKNMVPLNLVEGSCGKCHGTEINQVTPTLAKGDDLIDSYYCGSCHQLGEKPDLTTPAPELSNVGGKVNYNWLKKWLDYPTSYDATAKMPDFLLTPEETSALTDYLRVVKKPERLKTFRKVAEQMNVFDIETLDEDALDERLEKGRLSFSTRRCLSCHQLNGRGGNLAPELSRIVQKTNRHWLNAWIKNPHLWDDQTIMPEFNLTDDEIINLVEYLIDESEEIDEEENQESTKLSVNYDLNESELRGLNHFVNKGCLNCHSMAGIEKSGNFAASLAEMADLKIEQLGFGNATIPKTKYDFIATKLQNTKLFGKDLIMPFYNLTPVEIGQITLALMGKSLKIPESYRVSPAIEDPHLPKGSIGEMFDRYRCLSCHKVRGVGSDLAPDLTDEGSKVQKGWLKSFFKTPYAIRPYLVERMPRFNLTENEAGLLADYISLALRAEGIDALKIPEEEGDAVIGKQLYFDDFTCQSCHSIGAKGGYYGSALDTVGDRLTRKWMMARLENVHWYESNAREPAMDIKSEQALHLTAFLQELKQKGSNEK